MKKSKDACVTHAWGARQIMPGWSAWHHSRKERGLRLTCLAWIFFPGVGKLTRAEAMSELRIFTDPDAIKSSQGL